jgi:hypothetical protein
VWLDRSGQVRRKNLIAGSICLAVLPCFALFAVAQQQRAAAQQPAAAQQVQPTHYITMPPGFSIRYESPRPFASVASGNPAVADGVPGQTDRILVITSKPEVEGQTNFLLVDGSGQEVGNVLVTVTNPEPVREGNKVVVHNKIGNLAGFTNYLCNPICIRLKDDMEGADRVPQRNLYGGLSSTINQTTTTPPAPAGTP